jgi:hypothetical protein
MKTVTRLYPKNLSSYEGISFTFGFPVPVAFAQFLSGLYEYCRQDGKKCLALFERLTHLMLDGLDARYQQTPPEMFPFASLGVDGIHYGYLVHAPELPIQDYPVGQIAPMDRRGVTLFGNNTREALDNWVAEVIDQEGDEEQREELLRLSQVFGLKPDIEKARLHSGFGDYALPIRPSVPPHWRYLPSSDGVGVLAPAEKFEPRPLATVEKHIPDEYFNAADKALANNYPATALYYLREGYWYNWTDEQAAQRFSYRLATVYTELIRPTLADIAVWRVNKFFIGKQQH